VDPQKAKATSEWQGRTYYFCCAGCRTEFEASPSSFASRPLEKSSPVHIHRARPASIGQATQGGPNAAVTQEGAEATRHSIYTCPMDPEVRQERRGAPRALLLPLSYGPGGAGGRPGASPKVRHGAGAGRCRAAHADRMDLP